jgi:hypothetical protein
MPDRVLFSYIIIHQVPRRGFLGSQNSPGSGPGPYAAREGAAKPYARS